MSFPTTRRPVRELAALAIALLCVHAAFTAAIRGYVVPRLTPSVHWQYGLQTNSDSQVYHQEAVRLLGVMQKMGWSHTSRIVPSGFDHTWLIANLYYLTGTDTPYIAYAANGLIYTLNGLLLFAFLHRACAVPSRMAIGATALLSLSPLYLFSHSELLREPIAVLAGLLFVVGLLEVSSLRALRPAAVSDLFAGAAACAIGFVLLTSIRTYLLVPLLLPISGMLALLAIGFAVAHETSAPSRQLTVLAALFGGLVFFWVMPGHGRVQQYSDASIRPLSPTVAPSISQDPVAHPVADPVTAPVASARVEAWKESFVKEVDSTRPDRAALLAPHWCTIAWKRSAWLPAFIDSKLEALSCAREDFLRFCDQQLLGTHADRFCDEVQFSTASDVLKHTPKAAAFGLLVPYPRVWTDGFGSNGTGIRRIGYVIDGVTAYILLAGLFGIVLAARTRPDLLMATVGLLGVVTLFALAIPSQFILARIRLALYVPLLALGAAGWLLMLRAKGSEAPIDERRSEGRKQQQEYDGQRQTEGDEQINQ